MALAPVTLSNFLSNMQSGKGAWQASRRYYFVVMFKNDNRRNGFPRIAAGLNDGTRNQQFDIIPWGNDLSMLVKSMKIPEYSLKGRSGSTFDIINTDGSYIGMEDVTVLPSENTFSLTFLDTVNPIIESVCLPWLLAMKTQELRVYSSLRGSNVQISFYDNECDNQFSVNPDKGILNYEFTNIFPTSIGPPEADQTALNLSYRTVNFAFNEMVITNEYAVTKENKILGIEAGINEGIAAGKAAATAAKKAVEAAATAEGIAGGEAAGKAAAEKVKKEEETALKKAAAKTSNKTFTGEELANQEAGLKDVIKNSSNQEQRIAAIENLNKLNQQKKGFSPADLNEYNSTVAKNAAAPKTSQDYNTTQTNALDSAKTNAYNKQADYKSISDLGKAEAIASQNTLRKQLSRIKL